MNLKTYMSKFINIYMNVDNARKTYIMKRRKYQGLPCWTGLKIWRTFSAIFTEWLLCLFSVDEKLRTAKTRVEAST